MIKAGWREDPANFFPQFLCAVSATKFQPKIVMDRNWWKWWNWWNKENQEQWCETEEKWSERSKGGPRQNTVDRRPCGWRRQRVVGESSSIASREHRGNCLNLSQIFMCRGSSRKGVRRGETRSRGRPSKGTNCEICPAEGRRWEDHVANQGSRAEQGSESHIIRPDLTSMVSIQ